MAVAVAWLPMMFLLVISANLNWPVPVKLVPLTAMRPWLIQQLRHLRERRRRHEKQAQ